MAEDICRCQAPLRGGVCSQCGQPKEACPCPVNIDRDPRNADWLKPSRDIEQGRFKDVDPLPGERVG